MSVLELEPGMTVWGWKEETVSHSLAAKSSLNLAKSWSWVEPFMDWFCRILLQACLELLNPPAHWVSCRLRPWAVSAQGCTKEYQPSAPFTYLNISTFKILAQFLGCDLRRKLPSSSPSFPFTAWSFFSVISKLLLLSQQIISPLLTLPVEKKSTPRKKLILP